MFVIFTCEKLGGEGVLEMFAGLEVWRTSRHLFKNAVNTGFHLHRLYSETMMRLRILQRRVQEGRDVLPASDFARWLQFSGMIPLFKENAQDGVSKIDGSLLESTVEQLLQNCNERLRTNNDKPSFDRSDYCSLHEKLDMVAGYLSKLSVAPAVVVEPTVANEKNGCGSCAHRTRLDVMPDDISAPLNVGNVRRNNNGNDAEAHGDAADAVGFTPRMSLSPTVTGKR
jgi:hypothetical protein